MNNAIENIRVEKHIIKDKTIIKQIDSLCFKSKNLYNVAMYYIRQGLSYKQENPHENVKLFVEKFNNNILALNEKKNKSYKIITKENYFIHKYTLVAYLRFINDPDFRSLPSASAAVVVMRACEKWEEFFKSIKEYNKNPSKYTGRPKPPKYKDKESGRFMLSFPNEDQRKINNNVIYIRDNLIPPIKTSLNFNNIKLCDITVNKNVAGYEVNAIYKFNSERIFTEDEPNKVIGIDLGIDNICTISNNFGDKPYIINGKPIKSINQFYNKQISKHMSYIGNRGTSNKLKSLHKRRNDIIKTHLHHISKNIINYCVDKNIQTIVIGKNKGWKQEVDMGGVTNQKFSYIPYEKLIFQIKYKSSRYGIKVVMNEESYTSKMDALSKEKLKKGVSAGKRIKRGLFIRGDGNKINADVNGSLNILRKVIGDEFIDEINENRYSVTPYKINTLKNVLSVKHTNDNLDKS